MTLTGIINTFIEIGQKVIPFLASVAFLAFVWGTARFIRSTGSESDMKKNKKLLIWGVIGLLVMVSLWGIIAFLRSEAGFSGDPIIPQIPEKF